MSRCVQSAGRITIQSPWNPAIQAPNNANANNNGSIVQIGSGTLTLDGGIALTNGAMATYIYSPVIVNAAQSWTNDSSSILVVGGGTTINQLITIDGSGIVAVAGTDGGNGGFLVTNGILQAGGKSGSDNHNASNDPFGTGTITLGDGSSADNATVRTYSGGVNVSNPIVVAAGGAGIYTIGVTNGAQSTYSGPITLGNNLNLDSGTGTNVGGLTLSGAITGSSTITIVGSGSPFAASSPVYGVTLSGNSTGFTGNVDLTTGSVLHTLNANALGVSGVVTVANGASLDFQGASQNYTIPSGVSFVVAGNGVNGGGALLDSNNFSSTVAGKITLTGDTLVTQQNTNGATLTLAGVIDDGGNSYGLIKGGVGNVALTGANTYTGATTINLGTLTLDYSAASTLGNIIGSTGDTPLAINGGTLTVNGKGGQTTTQSFSSTTIGGGSSRVNINGNGGTPHIGLGALTRTAGAYGVVDITANGAVTTTSANDATGIIGPWATFGNLSDYATVSATTVAGLPGTQIVALNAPAGADPSGWNSTVNYNLNGSITVSADSSLNTLRYTSGNSTLDLGGNNFTTNGILNGGSGPLTITNLTGNSVGNVMIAGPEVDIGGRNGIIVDAPVLWGPSGGAGDLWFGQHDPEQRPVNGGQFDRRRHDRGR